MRDILVTLIVFGSLPFILKRPYVGILMWVWISVMNPHRETWGFAYSFPFAAVVAGTTLLSLLFTREPRNFPVTPVTLTLIALVLWINVSTVFALDPDNVYEMWSRVMKIMLMNVVALMLLKTRQHVQLLMLVVIFSLGFYGVKGGIFTAISGGQYRVWGPRDSFIEGNNDLALALVMVIPLMHYLQMVSEKKWVRHALTVAMLLCALAALGTYSRGALLAIVAMAGFLWLKSQKKLLLGLLMAATIPFVVLFMPSQWTERMDTIATYQQDRSAMGRINAWLMAYHLARDRPLVGGGFAIYDARTFQKYAPDPNDIHAAHSIYFQALGEHGFTGLGLYLLLGFLTWRCGTWIVRNTARREDLKWAYHLASMVQVSLLGFAVGGLFLNLMYFDVPYYLMIALVVTRIVVERELRAASGARSPVLAGHADSGSWHAWARPSPPGGGNRGPQG
jgi:putative inorganic carbon (HCO3(-)) transporter